MAAPNDQRPAEEDGHDSDQIRSRRLCGGVVWLGSLGLADHMASNVFKFRHVRVIDQDKASAFTLIELLTGGDRGHRYRLRLDDDGSEQLGKPALAESFAKDFARPGQAWICPSAPQSSNARKWSPPRARRPHRRGDAVPLRGCAGQGRSRHRLSTRCRATPRQ
jgi:hypothetical protein